MSEMKDGLLFLLGHLLQCIIFYKIIFVALQSCENHISLKSIFHEVRKTVLFLTLWSRIIKLFWKVHLIVYLHTVPVIGYITSITLGGGNNTGNKTSSVLV